MALADAGVDAVLIIGPVTDERGDRAVYLRAGSGFLNR
jgi:hypothetical protein